MALEAEIKAPCPDAEKKAQALGARFLKSETQEDTYYSHPSRDYKKTDEALRIRNSNGLYITYKGPKKSKDLKIREEIEFQVPPDAYTLLERLGFKKAFTIRKTRQTYALDGLTICCDNVEGLGEYVEVESMGSGSKDRIMSVLEKFGVAGKATTKSYSELLGR